MRISQFPLYLMVLPGMILVLIYSYVPMGGIIIAFQNFIPAKGLFGDQEWVGWKNFLYMFKLPNFTSLLFNTLYIAILKIIVNMVFPIFVSLLLNELMSNRLKKVFQTMVYFPYFLSWVIIAGVMIDMLSPSMGLVNKLIGALGGTPVYFLGDPKVFPYTMVVTDLWKSFGFGTVVYLAALTNIDPTLYEAASIDGAGRWKQTLHVTLPGILPIVVLMLTLSLGNILNAGFEQIFNFYSPQVYETGDIIDTFVYRLGIIQARYSLATAVGLCKSLVSFIMISVSYYLASRYADYRIF
ncbi:MAG: ABC transporter permease subunit [Clostridiaceae bacterium]|nr:ABC transporter permease subunit [Clostridiaceae bacterium]